MIASLLIAATLIAQNPVLHFDFSDPDVCIGRDGRCYLTASSFGAQPGLPVLVSDDMVNWSYVGYALRHHPWETYSPEHGNAVWAPSIRYRADKDEYVIYWGDPDRGAFRVSAKDPAGPWSEPRLVVPGKGIIDTCPLYDDDGRVYLVNGWANSRGGMNSVLTVRELDADETRAIGEAVIVYDGVPNNDFTCEGPKFYKKDGEYWIWFPAGGVGSGWQVAIRGKTPYGPFERKVVLEQKDTNVNGPHQGGVVYKVDAASYPPTEGSREASAMRGAASQGHWFFMHFSDRDAYGRIVYLEPMTWEKGAWPVVGDNGRPVTTITIDPAPRTSHQAPFAGLQVSDEFNAPRLGLCWQWLGRGQLPAGFPQMNGTYRLYTTPYATNTWNMPNLLVQKFPAERFVATAKVQVGAKVASEEGGIIVQGRSYARLGLRWDGTDFEIVYTTCHRADKGNGEKHTILGKVGHRVFGEGQRSANVADIYLRVEVAPSSKGAGASAPPVPLCTFSWSTDGKTWAEAHAPSGEAFEAVQGQWIGATIGLYAVNAADVKDRGWMDIDWFRISEVK